MQSTTIAVDLAKSVFEVAVSRCPGSVSSKHRLTRRQFSRFLADQAPGVVVMEACGTAHHWAHEAQARGHDARLLPPRAVRPYVLGNKTDAADAKGILEAHRNEAVRSVPVKTVDQHALAGLHRLRSAWVATRTARLNTLRGLLREIGVFIPVGARQVVPHVWAVVSEPGSEIPEPLGVVLMEAAREIGELETRIQSVEKQLKALVARDPLLCRLQTVPGIGLLTATAMVAAIGDATRFPTGRHFASFIGLTPREQSSGNIRRLGSEVSLAQPCQMPFGAIGLIGLQQGSDQRESAKTTESDVFLCKSSHV